MGYDDSTSTVEGYYVHHTDGVVDIVGDLEDIDMLIKTVREHCHAAKTRD